MILPIFSSMNRVIGYKWVSLCQTINCACEVQVFICPLGVTRLMLHNVISAILSGRDFERRGLAPVSDVGASE